MLFIIAAASVAVVALLAAGVIIVVVKYNRNEEYDLHLHYLLRIVGS